MTSTRVFFILIVVTVLGVLLFKPKSKSIEQIETAENISASESEAEKNKSGADKTEIANSSVTLNSGELSQPKNLAPVDAIVTPIPSSEAEITPPESPTAESNLNSNEALKKLNESKLKGVFRMPKVVELDPQQKTQLDSIEKKFTPQLEAQLNKMEDVLSDDQKRARNEALVGLVFEGDRPDVKYDVVRNAMNLTGEQERQLRELNREFNKTRSSARKEMVKHLTPEQQSALPPNWLGGRRRSGN